MKILQMLFTIPVIAFCAFKTSAQTINRPVPAALNHIAFYVTDLKTTTDFYNDVFGPGKMTEPFNDGKHTWFKLGPGIALHIIAGATQKETHIIQEHLCFSVSSINEFTKKLNERKIVYMNYNKAAGEVTLRADGVHQIFLQDPEGHWIEVNDARN